MDAAKPQGSIALGLGATCSVERVAQSGTEGCFDIHDGDSGKDFTLYAPSLEETTRWVRSLCAVIAATAKAAKVGAKPTPLGMHEGSALGVAWNGGGAFAQMWFELNGRELMYWPDQLKAKQVSERAREGAPVCRRARANALSPLLSLSLSLSLSFFLPLFSHQMPRKACCS